MRSRLVIIKFTNMLGHMKFKWFMFRYHFKHSIFKWTQDEEGDICFRLFWILHFVKYKEHTTLKFGFIKMESAPKHIDLNA